MVHLLHFAANMKLQNASSTTSAPRTAQLMIWIPNGPIMSATRTASLKGPMQDYSIRLIRLLVQPPQSQIQYAFFDKDTVQAIQV